MPLIGFDEAHSFDVAVAGLYLMDKFCGFQYGVCVGCGLTAEPEQAVVGYVLFMHRIATFDKAYLRWELTMIISFRDDKLGSSYFNREYCN